MDRRRLWRPCLLQLGPRADRPLPSISKPSRATWLHAERRRVPDLVAEILATLANPSPPPRRSVRKRYRPVPAPATASHPRRLRSKARCYNRPTSPSGGMADAGDLKSPARKGVRVRPPPRAHIRISDLSLSHASARALPRAMRWPQEHRYAYAPLTLGSRSLTLRARNAARHLQRTERLQLRACCDCAGALAHELARHLLVLPARCRSASAPRVPARPRRPPATGLMVARGGPVDCGAADSKSMPRRVTYGTSR
jgi:hypothetical protein